MIIKEFMKRVDAAQIEHEAEKAKKKAEKMEPVVFKTPKFEAPKYSRKTEKPQVDDKEAGIIIEQRSLEEIEAEKKQRQMEKHCQVSTACFLSCFLQIIGALRR